MLKPFSKVMYGFYFQSAVREIMAKTVSVSVKIAQMEILVITLMDPVYIAASLMKVFSFLVQTFFTS